MVPIYGEFRGFCTVSSCVKDADQTTAHKKSLCGHTQKIILQSV